MVSFHLPFSWEGTQTKPRGSEDRKSAPLQGPHPGLGDSTSMLTGDTRWPRSGPSDGVRQHPRVSPPQSSWTKSRAHPACLGPGGGPHWLWTLTQPLRPGPPVLTRGQSPGRGEGGSAYVCSRSTCRIARPQRWGGTGSRAGPARAVQTGACALGAGGRGSPWGVGGPLRGCDRSEATVSLTRPAN